MQQGVSVLICTYNGEKKLPTTLKHLANQKLKDFPCEILLVVNASTDNTAAIASATWQTYGERFSLRIVEEQRLGKDYALYTGLKLSQYSYVVVCDDDNWLDELYIQHAFEMMRDNPDIGVLGGKGIPVFEKQPPVWIYQFERFYAFGKQSLKSGEIKSDLAQQGSLWGAGCVINMKAYQILTEAGYNRLITYEHYPRFRCEDLELCLAIRLTGYKIWYDNKLTFQHFISADRLQWAYLMRLSESGGLGAALLRPYYEICIGFRPRSSNQWLHHLFACLDLLLYHIIRTKNAINFLFILFQLDKYKEGSYNYQNLKVQCFQLYGVWYLRKQYNNVYRNVLALKYNISKLKMQ